MTNAELNRAVAEKVMGWREDERASNNFGAFPCADEHGSCRCFGPAEDIRDAMEAVERWAAAIADRHWHLDAWSLTGPFQFECTLHDGNHNGAPLYRSKAGSPALALCTALLAAHGIEA